MSQDLAAGEDPGASNTSSFVSALVVAAITVTAFTTIWAVLHRRKNLHKVYQPRVQLAPESKRPKALPDGIAAFWRTVLKTPDQDIIVSNGLDAYLFVRFLRVFGIKLLVPYFLLTFAICIPVSAAGPTAGLEGLNILTFGNVSPFHTNRRIAHMLVAVILMSWTAWTLWKEYSHFVALRQAWLTSTQHLTLARSRTVVITGLPKQYDSIESIRELAQTVTALPGNQVPRVSMADDRTLANNQSDDNVASAPQVWLARDVKKVEEVWEDRDKECGRLEGGVGKLLQLATKNQKKGKTPEAKGEYDAERDNSFPAHRYVAKKKVPTWKQGPLGLWGNKMDLDSSPEFIAKKNDELRDMRANLDEYKVANTAFIRFASQHEAHNFARLAGSLDSTMRLTQRSVEVVPEDVQWSNTSMNAYQRKVRTFVSWAITIGIIITWAFPVAFVGTVSNIDQMCETLSFVAWVCDLPAPAVGIIRGVLPPALLSVLFMVLPMVLRMLVKLQGEVLQSEIELGLFTRYWLFQVIHGFLIITAASGLIGALQNIGETAGNLPTLLAEKLPGASIFFLTFILTATFAGAAKAFSQLVPFIMYSLRGFLGGNTPRKWYTSQYKMTQFKWGTLWPPVCLLTTVTIVYSVIQPVITLLAMLAFCMLFAAYKYQLNWVADQPDRLETGGLFYIKAMRTVFVALYLEGICLAGLFFLSTDAQGGRSTSGIACGVIMAVMTGLVAGLQVYIDWFAYKKPYLVYVHSTHPAKGGSGPAAAPKHAPVPTNASAVAEQAGAELGNTSGFHERAFEHPALWKKQPVVWVADDTLGLGRDQVDRINAKRVEASTEYASMDKDGKLDVQRGPPDEAWYGGYSS